MEPNESRSLRVRTRRLLTAGLVVCSFGVLSGAAAPAALATNHDFCNWDSSYNQAPNAWSLCPAEQSRYIWQNYGYMPFGPSGGNNVYCGAAWAGTQYGSNTSGPSQCVHAYAGTTDLTAYIYVGPTGPAIHGIISY
jgi:hypothetical protein